MIFFMLFAVILSLLHFVHFHPLKKLFNSVFVSFFSKLNKRQKRSRNKNDDSESDSDSDSDASSDSDDELKDSGVMMQQMDAKKRQTVRNLRLVKILFYAVPEPFDNL